ncbi:Holliday junction branch migration protein RuvA [Solemya elarraichensis gill symbiont]|uniref:Holliday junction branch migration complex subunit RuvA n=1 Tax=Solemya elarraichensis gill symbiont TaxID=1918949 RepID=A0A1T2LAH6_9GAMM|nr:Holliday junction branch migration protein RuvA [Solemya elarraichensis gill symbiont]OOZ42091.1 Holliday junction DNA helicase RuvA [Solemya elarraichensis gill symbiont]
MIGRLYGTLVVKQAPFLLIDVNGVGYEVEAPMSTFYELPETGQQAQLYTHLVVRDDAHILFGFFRESERTLFRTLLKVSGVGGKMALAILSGMSAEDFVLCVQSDDHATLTRIPGVGKKTAQRLVIEMKDKVADFAGVPSVAGKAQVQAVTESPESEAVSALVALGYKAADATKMVKSVAQDEATSEELIRTALQSTVKGKG